MQRAREEGQVAVVVILDGVGEGLVLERLQVLKVDVEGGEVVEPEAVNLRYVVFVACERAGGWGAGDSDVFDETRGAR